MKGQEVTRPLVMQPILLILLDAGTRGELTHRCVSPFSLQTTSPKFQAKRSKQCELMSDLLQQWPGYSHHAGVQQGSPTQHRYPYYDSRCIVALKPFLHCAHSRNGYYVHPGAGQGVAGDPGGGR